MKNFLNRNILIRNQFLNLTDSESDSIEEKSDFDGYRAYMEADEREIARMKRTGEYSTRKRGKKRKRSTS